MYTPVVLLNVTPRRLIANEAPASADGRETGGILLGHDQGDDVLVTTAGGPGPKADRRIDGFKRDLTFSQELADDAYGRDGSVWIGEWHTHPTGLPTPSDIDLNTYADLLGDGALGFDRIVSIIVVPCAVHGWREMKARAWVATKQSAMLVPLFLKRGKAGGGSALVADGTWGGDN